MMNAPIPLFLLPHTAVLKRKVTDDGWGGAQYKELPLYHIRIEPCWSQTFSLSGDIPQVSGRLFFDCVNSLPTGTAFIKGDTVVFNGREYTVSKVYEYYAKTDMIHHYEVLLS